jgi:hypothetical protein
VPDPELPVPLVPELPVPPLIPELPVPLDPEVPVPPLIPELPVLPLVEPDPVVAPGADAGGVADGLVVLDEELLLGDVVLGVVVVLEGLLVSFLPQPYSAAATMTNTRVCFTM